MKRVLIISPYFPPVNSADMHRVRISLPYFEKCGWQAEVVVVNPCFTDMPIDNLLRESLPANVKIHQVGALNKRMTAKFGLGSVALRSLPYYKRYVDRLLSRQKFDLIYFTTTQFPICWLGKHWKHRFGVPYVIDLQDPWHSDYYQNKLPSERPKKYWFSYRLNKFLEARSMKEVGGLISVSEEYINNLRNRYPTVRNVPGVTLPFGAFAADLLIARKASGQFPNLLSPGFKNAVYVGRGGSDMDTAVGKFFQGFRDGLERYKTKFQQLRIHFIGTSYAPKGQGVSTIIPLAREFGLDEYVIEQTDRISYYHSLATLDRADVLFIPGSDSPGYTASKIYPYLLSQKPLMAIFDVDSPALAVLDDHGVTAAFNYEQADPQTISSCLEKLLTLGPDPIIYNHTAIERYSAQAMTAAQCQLFDRVMAAI